MTNKKKKILQHQQQRKIADELVIEILNYCGLNQEPLNFKFREGESDRSRVACLMALVFKVGSFVDQYLQDGYWKYLAMGWSGTSHQNNCTSKSSITNESNNNRSRYAKLMHNFKEEYKKIRLNQNNIDSSTTNRSCAEEFKILVVGKEDVGKSAIQIQYVMGHFIKEKYDPTIQETIRKMTSVDDYLLRMVVDDCIISREEYQSGECFLLVCSVTDRSSLSELENILVEKLKDRIHLPYAICLNKIDLDPTLHQFGLRDVYELFTKHPTLANCPIILTSATRNETVSEVFNILIRFRRIMSVIGLLSVVDEQEQKKKCILC